MRPSLVALGFLMVAVTACGGSGATGSHGTWVGTITTEDNVTTVVNESGSVWGGTATLVEEASIGVDAGPDEYILGRVGSVYATGELIYVVDAQVPAVRAYTVDGEYVLTLGREGQGPGEYQRPAVVAAEPTSGRVFVFDTAADRVTVFSRSGDVDATWTAQDVRCCAWRMWPSVSSPMGGLLWVPVQVPSPQTGERRDGVRAHGPGGALEAVRWVPEFRYVRPTFEADGARFPVPFTPAVAWATTPGGGLLAGSSDSYGFEVHSPDGSVLVVERFWEPVAVPAEHQEWQRRFTVAQLRDIGMGGLSWDGAGIPDHKPAFDVLHATLSGEVWVARDGPSERIPDCANDPLEAGAAESGARPCWRAELLLDVFSADGRYLGSVEVPLGLQRSANSLFVDGDRIVAVVQDEAGTIMVKRYRLVLPEEQTQ